MKRRAFIAATFALGGCALFGVLDRDRLVGGYELLALPVSEVPVGAQWVQGAGPVGPGASPDNLVVQRSLSALSLDRSVERSLEVKLADWAGLSPSAVGRLTVTVAEVSIHRVKDIAALRLEPGDAFIYDAMKANSIRISVDRSSRDKIAATLRDRGLDVSADADGAAGEALAVEGADLFFAYRVMRVDEDSRAGEPLIEALRNPHAPGW